MYKFYPNLIDIGHIFAYLPRWHVPTTPSLRKQVLEPTFFLELTKNWMSIFKVVLIYKFGTMKRILCPSGLNFIHNFVAMLDEW